MEISNQWLNFVACHSVVAKVEKESKSQGFNYEKKASVGSDLLGPSLVVSFL